MFETSGEDRSDHKLAAALTLGGFYAGFVTWSYFAWYRNAESQDFKWGGDGNWRLWQDSGWFGPKTYAGGADKLGHAWATYGLARGGTELLHQWGGYSKLTSSLVAAALSEALFFGVEIKDGFHYEFSFGDLTFNTSGALLAVLLSNYPRADELVDFRVEYWPSKAYVRQFEGGNVNIAEDYSGQTYLLAFHLGGIPALRESKYGSWSRFVDVVGGYETRGYKPDPPEDVTGEYTYSQRAYLGLSLNAQGLFDWLLDGRSKPARKITHGFFEVFNMPYGSFGIVDGQRSPDGKPDGGGA